MQRQMFAALLSATRHQPYRTVAESFTSPPVRIVTRRKVRVKSIPTPVRTVIVGAGLVGQRLAASLELRRTHEVLGFIDDNPAALATGRWPILGCRQETPQIVNRLDIQEVLIAYAPTWQQELAETLTASTPGLRVRIVPSAFEACLRTSRVEHHGDIAIVALTSSFAAFPRAAKRLLDGMCALIGLILLAPITALAMLAVKLTSPGPVIFSQTRVGLNGRHFKMYKLRTMIHDAESKSGPIRSPGSNDDRLTPAGRWLRLFRLDEIPQLWNVLIGDMSIVGPRPERPMFADKYARTTPSYVRRHVVLPGITGLAQVCGGYHTDARDKLRFDLLYISHWSLWVDFVIILRTISVVLFPETERFESRNPETA